MHLLKNKIEQPWAFSTREKIEPWMAKGNVYRYFETREEAEKAAMVYDRKKIYRGPIERRPGESYFIGYL